MLLTLALAAAHATTVHDVPNPRAHGSWVADVADVLEPAVEARLDDHLDALHRDLGVEVAVVTVPGVDGTPKAFATELFNHWGVGREGVDDGLLVLLVMDERRLEMETGYGMEAALPDGWLAGMQQQHMVPRFKEGRFDAGLEAGVLAVGQRLRAHGPIEPGAVARRPAGEDGSLLGFGLLFGGVVVVGGAGGVAWSRRPRRCPTCEQPMTLLDEVDDDDHLDPGQLREEHLGSVDWRVWACGEHGVMEVRPRRAWLTSYKRCPSCSYRTLDRSTETLVAATVTHGGQVRVTEDCAHCGHRSQWVRRTPRLDPPSSSSSFGGGGGGGGGGGSFGGGSSGGGGAGSSW